MFIGFSHRRIYKLKIAPDLFDQKNALLCITELYDYVENPTSNSPATKEAGAKEQNGVWHSSDLHVLQEIWHLTPPRPTTTHFTEDNGSDSPIQQMCSSK